MHTGNNGQATFTVLLGPKSNAGLYDTEIEVSKDRYQSSFEQIDLNVVPESQQGVIRQEAITDRLSVEMVEMVEML